MEALKSYFRAGILAGQEFGKKDLIIRSAALAYFTIFSLPPFLLVLMRTTSIFYDPETIRQTIFGQLGSVFGEQSARQLTDTVQAIGLFEREGWALFVGIGVTLFTATTIFSSIQSTLNKIFVSEEAAERMAWWVFIRTRLLSLALLLSIAFVLVVSLTVNAVITKLLDYLFTYYPGVSGIVVFLVSFLLPLIVITGLFILIFKFLPDKKIPWKVAATGGLITAVLFFIGKYLIELYIGLSKPGNLYDAAGSIMVVMVWVFYASAIFYFGAQYTAVFHRAFIGSSDEHAAPERGIRDIDGDEPIDNKKPEAL